MDYSNGKIYMLEPTCEYEEGDVYYGSTATTLVKRLSNHKSISNKAKSKYLIDKYGRDNIKIVLIKMFPCSCKAELSAEEGKYQRANKCVNKQIAGRSDKEYYQDNREKVLEYQKEYKQANREKIVEQNKEYKQANREKIVEQNKEYYQDNREKIAEQTKKYKQANRDKINARRRQLRAEKKSQSIV
jgi:hypothetical protein